jgi:hypothetical protein
MKLCPECEPEANCCDFCKHYKFNANERGAYTGNGMCSYHNRPQDPSDFVCDDFECFKFQNIMDDKN